MKIKLLFICLFASFTFVNAQDDSKDVLSVEDNDSQWLQNRIGGYGSFFSGYGLSYQYQFENGISLKTQLFAFGSDDDSRNYNTDEIQLTYGIDIQYNLNRTNDTRFYALAGTFIDYREEGHYYSSSLDDKDFDIERCFNVGVGFGIEVMAWEDISVVVEGGYYGRFGNNTVTDYYSSYGNTIVKINETPRSFGFGVGGGLFYAF